MSYKRINPSNNDKYKGSIPPKTCKISRIVTGGSNNQNLIKIAHWNIRSKK
jgi:hypothetical protein